MTERHIKVQERIPFGYHIFFRKVTIDHTCFTMSSTIEASDYQKLWKNVQSPLDGTVVPDMKQYLMGLGIEHGNEFICTGSPLLQRKKWLQKVGLLKDTTKSKRWCLTKLARKKNLFLDMALYVALGTVSPTLARDLVLSGPPSSDTPGKPNTLPSVVTPAVRQPFSPLSSKSDSAAGSGSDQPLEFIAEEQTGTNLGAFEYDEDLSGAGGCPRELTYSQSPPLTQPSVCSTHSAAASLPSVQQGFVFSRHSRFE